MKLYTEQDAKRQWCPNLPEMSKCLGSDCMAWNHVEDYFEREDHSGARQRMQEVIMKRADGAVVERKGPSGSCGILYLEARGFCGKYQHGDK